MILSNAIVYNSEYLARCDLVLRANVSIDSNAVKALSGLVHITSSAESIIRSASLFPQDVTNADINKNKAIYNCFISFIDLVLQTYIFAGFFAKEMIGQFKG